MKPEIPAYMRIVARSLSDSVFSVSPRSTVTILAVDPAVTPKSNPSKILEKIIRPFPH